MISYHTLNNSMLSNLCRGTTVTNSISARKATSDGTRPGGNGRAICAILAPIWRGAYGRGRSATVRI